jgi:hypothetical protein
MPSKAEIIKELDFVTDTLSKQVRTTALGTLVFAWGLLVGESAAARSIAGQVQWHLVGVGAVSILAMLFDFLQYVAGYRSVKALYDKMDVENQEEGWYDETSYSYRLRFLFF